MRARPAPRLLAFALLLAADPTAAAPIAVSASLRIEIGGLAPVYATGSGIIDVSGGVYTIPAGLVSLGNATIPVTASTAVNSLIASGIANLSATFAPGGVTSQVPGEVCLVPAVGRACVAGGGIGGVMPVTGLIGIHVIPHIVVIPVDVGAFALGEGGSTNAPFTFDGAPWTTGVARVGLGGFPTVFTTATTGSVAGGSLTLVSAAFVAACGNLLPITASFTLTPLVPEPGALALIAIGAAGLLALALRRR